MQVDANGNNEWTDFREFDVSHGEASSIVLPDDFDAVWIRFQVDRDCVATAFLHQTSSYPNSEQGHAPKEPLFAGIADATDDEVIGGLVYPAKRNRNLRIVSADGRGYQLTKSSFEFETDHADEKLQRLLEFEPEFRIDEASVVVESKGKRYRLPKGDSTFDEPFSFGWPRAVREVESERHLANIHGTFYELPLITNGAPPAWNLIRPVSSHRKQIADFCSWNGLLVLSGIKPDANRDGHVFKSGDLNMGLWCGGIDDLWKLGKPTGNGGPWKDTQVHAHVPSDPYLMRGYDEKTATLSHGSTTPVQITLQIDIDGNGRWVTHETFSVPAGEKISHPFPEGFSACWVRAVSDTDTTTTVQLEYR